MRREVYARADNATVLCRVGLLFVVLTIAATWPQALRMNSIPDNVDAYFSLWRLGWIAHQLPADPSALFHTNIFYPEKYPLAYSDAVLLEGLLALPFIRAGIPIVYVYNGLVLGSFVASGLAMFILVRRLTRATLPAILAGLVLAFTPYRFDHYFHLELLWVAWMPLTLWMVHRSIEHGRLRDGVVAGIFVALQVLSSIYYGVALSSVLIVFAIPLILGAPAAVRRPALVALVAGAALAFTVVAPYMLPYRQVQSSLGERNVGEALLNAAGPRHYLAAMPDSRLEGWLTGHLGRHEKRLFPGFVALALAAVGLWPPLTRTTVAYACVVVVAMNLSFGPAGIGYEWLRENVVVYRGLRAPARFGQVAILGVGVLAAFGCVKLRAWLADRGHRADAVVVALLFLAFAEYLIKPMNLTAVPTVRPPTYDWLRTQSKGVVAELPMPTRLTAPLHEGIFEYLSTFHWRPIVNGYSGTWSVRYVGLIDQVAGFPDHDSIQALSAAGVDYLLLHERYFGRERHRQILEQARDRPSLQLLRRFEDDEFEIAVYRLSR